FEICQLRRSSHSKNEIVFFFAQALREIFAVRFRQRCAVCVIETLPGNFSRQKRSCPLPLDQFFRLPRPEKIHVATMPLQSRRKKMMNARPGSFVARIGGREVSNA